MLLLEAGAEVDAVDGEGSPIRSTQSADLASLVGVVKGRGSGMGRKSPQQKKLLSYLKDRRNNYGENDKSSRKSIRRNKRASNSANRRREQLALATLAGTDPPDESGAYAIEQDLHRRRPKIWKKFPDLPLGQVVIGGLERRVRMGIDDGGRAQDRVRRVRKRLGGANRP